MRYIKGGAAEKFYGLYQSKNDSKEKNQFTDSKKGWISLMALDMASFVEAGEAANTMTLWAVLYGKLEIQRRQFIIWMQGIYAMFWLLRMSLTQAMKALQSKAFR